MTVIDHTHEDQREVAESARPPTTPSLLRELRVTRLERRLFSSLAFVTIALMVIQIASTGRL